MIFYLSSLPSDAYSQLQKVYSMYTEGALKGQRTLKKNTRPLDLKGSKFKPFRGLNKGIVFQLLCELSQKKISLAEMAVECNSRKQLVKVQLAFCKSNKLH